MKLIANIIKAICYLWVVASGSGIGVFLGLCVYNIIPNTLGSALFIVLSISGIVSGFYFAGYVKRKWGIFYMINIDKLSSDAENIQKEKEQTH